MSESTEQNPVFHYRAGFRALANSVQKWLILGGIAISLIGKLGLLFARPSKGDFCLPCALMIFIVLGGVLVLTGIAWGFYWRKKIRDEFRAKFGP